MNQSALISLPGLMARPAPASSDALEARYAFRVTAGLTERSLDLGADVTERLRFAREKALERARVASASTVTAKAGVTRSGAVMLGRSGWWIGLGSVLPALALVSGLVLIQRWQDNAQIAVAAEVDAALLSDDLPPKAYSDAGFAEFLKAPSE